MNHNSFDAQPDPELGHLLRECLDAPDADGFAARVRVAMAAQRPADGSWDVLARWARPGLAAAAIVIMSLGVWLGRVAQQQPATLADALQPSDAPAALFAVAGGAPGSEDLLAEEAP
jgi:hypothetical protein